MERKEESDPAVVQEKGPKIHEFKNPLPRLATINELIKEGMALKKSTHFGVLDGDERRLKLGDHSRYLAWKDDAELFLREHGFRDEAEQFAEADDVPILVRIVEPVNYYDALSVQIIRAIRKEATEKLRTLRAVRANLDGSRKGSLRGKPIKFDEARSMISVDGKECQLPPQSHEAYLARAIFKRRIAEHVDWSLLYEEIVGGSALRFGKEIQEKERRMVRDTKERFNNRICDFFHTDDELLTWRNMGLFRNF